MDDLTLKASLEACLSATDEMLRVMMDEAALMDINVYQMRDRSGLPSILPLIQTRTTALAALVALSKR